ncbi:hypothetical protein V5P93_001906 [Actinokineospora auranticolor]|uniref:hypothetical protein n=1 Tax=Actinokineospora auranticolor TaxID=155976 RepID=UPI0015E486C0|nr:hypothetical protein [Actinokineospora auranticolor]
MGEELLDNPAWAALTGPHQSIARRYGDAAGYPDDVSPFHAVPTGSAREWADLAAMATPGSGIVVPGATQAPPGWPAAELIDGVQMVDDGVTPAPDPEALRLTAADVPEMLDLVARTQPGPFRPRARPQSGWAGRGLILCRGAQA